MHKPCEGYCQANFANPEGLRAQALLELHGKKVG